MQQGYVSANSFDIVRVIYHTLYREGSILADLNSVHYPGFFKVLNSLFYQNEFLKNFGFGKGGG